MIFEISGAHNDESELEKSQGRLKASGKEPTYRDIANGLRN